MSSSLRTARARTLVGVLMALAAACSSPYPHPSSADVATLRPSDPSARLEDLERGRTLYMGKCGSCHLLHPPSTIAPDEWPGKVMKMQNEGRVHLKDDELRDIIRYVRAASLASH
jgi:mono/diheme cytochrome c family protein